MNLDIDAFTSSLVASLDPNDSIEQQFQMLETAITAFINAIQEIKPEDGCVWKVTCTNHDLCGDFAVKYAKVKDGKELCFLLHRSDGTMDCTDKDDPDMISLAAAILLGRLLP